MKNLMSNTNYGKRLETEFCLCNIDYKKYFILRNNYDNFLLQPLENWMFVPCDEDGNVLEEPILEPICCGFWEDDGFGNPICCNQPVPNFTQEYDIYQQAKQRCLFEGFEYKKEIRNSGGNYTHFLKNKEIEIYIQWGGFYVFGKNENKVETIEDLVKYKPLLTAKTQKDLGL